MWLMLHLSVLNLNFFFYNSKIDFLFFSYINKSKNAAYNYFFKCHVISFCDNVKKILKKKNKKQIKDTCLLCAFKTIWNFRAHKWMNLSIQESLVWPKFIKKKNCSIKTFQTKNKFMNYLVFIWISKQE